MQLSDPFCGEVNSYFVKERLGGLKRHALLHTEEHFINE